MSIDITFSIMVECKKCFKDLKATFEDEGIDENAYVVRVEPCQHCLNQMVFEEYKQRHSDEKI